MRLCSEEEVGKFGVEQTSLLIAKKNSFLRYVFLAKKNSFLRYVFLAKKNSFLRYVFLAKKNSCLKYVFFMNHKKMQLNTKYINEMFY